MANGGQYTLDEFMQCDRKKQMKIIDYLSNLKVYDEIIVNGKTFVLVHGGLGNFSLDKDLSDYTLKELVWERPDYSKVYFNDKYLVTGHTPTVYIEDNPKPGYIYKANHHLAIDCGCYLDEGRLGAIRLEDMKEFYIEKKER